MGSAKVWISPNIVTHYHLPTSGSLPRRFTVTRVEGGSCIRVNTGEGTEPALDIYLSSDKSKRDYALLTDFPNQLLEALQIRAFDAAADLHQYLGVPLESLNILLVGKGIMGEIPTSSAGSDTPESDETSEDEPTHHEDELRSREVVATLASPERHPTVTLLAAPMAGSSGLSAGTGQSVPTSRSPSNQISFPGYRQLKARSSIPSHRVACQRPPKDQRKRHRRSQLPLQVYIAKAIVVEIQIDCGDSLNIQALAQMLQDTAPTMPQTPQIRQHST